MKKQISEKSKKIYLWAIIVLMLGGIIFWCIKGINLSKLDPDTQERETPDPAKEQAYEDLVIKVLESNEDYWKRLLVYNDYEYVSPKVQFFSDIPNCKQARTFAGSIYCPETQTINLQTSFFETLFEQYSAKRREPIVIYLVAHQMGFHIQNILQITKNVEDLKQKESERELEFSIREDIQAGCFVGMWNHSMQGLEMFNRQKVAQVMKELKNMEDDIVFDPDLTPDRLNWFGIGYKNGEFKKCNTFQKQEWPRIRSIR